MAGDHFTVLIFSKNPSNVRRFKVPKFALGLILLVLPAFIVWAIVLGLNLLQDQNHPTLVVQLQEENQIRQREIRLFTERIAELQNSIVQMKEFDSKLRVIANLENLPSAFFGVGGPLPQDLRERIWSQQSPDAVAGPTQPVSILSVSKARPDETDARQMGRRVQRTDGQLPYVPLVWPTRGWIIGDFGCRISPLTGELQMHEGIRISNSSGTSIIAPADGLVTTVGSDPEHGRMVVLSHGYGIVTRYGHLGDVDVEAGQKVQRGQTIGKVGNTGHSIGPQLYYEVRVNGIPIDPRHYLYN